MYVRDIMQTMFVSVPEQTSYREIAEKLYGSTHGCVFVTDADHKLVGLVSEDDLLRILFPHYQSYYLNPELYTDPEEREKKIQEVQGHAVGGFMRRELHVVAPDEPIMRAAAKMLAKNMRRMPVVDQGALVGVITRRQIYQALYEGHLKTPAIYP